MVRESFPIVFRHLGVVSREQLLPVVPRVGEYIIFDDVEYVVKLVRYRVESKSALTSRVTIIADVEPDLAK